MSPASSAAVGSSSASHRLAGISPAGASREPVRPYGDDPLMLAMCHHLLQHGLADEVFLEKYCHEFERFADYVLGRGPDRAAKTPECASVLSGVPTERIRHLAALAASRRTLVNVTPSLRRAQHGERPVWAALSPACMLGSWQHPGGGFADALGSMGNSGRPRHRIAFAARDQLSAGEHPRMPVARVAHIRLHPGRRPLGATSGKIGLFWDVIAGALDAEAPGHACWLKPRRSGWTPRNGGTAHAAGREQPRDEAAQPARHRCHQSGVEGLRPRTGEVQRGGRAADGDVVVLSNDWGACLVGAVVSDVVMPGVVQLSTGAWFDPQLVQGVEMCVHGNPNVLTLHEGTSSLAQGCSGQLARVYAHVLTGPAPPVIVTGGPPEIIDPAG